MLGHQETEPGRGIRGGSARRGEEDRDEEEQVPYSLESISYISFILFSKLIQVVRRTSPGHVMSGWVVRERESYAKGNRV